jgi:hypothetical protein
MRQINDVQPVLKRGKSENPVSAGTQRAAPTRCYKTIKKP